jgi:hypothetical protein
MGTRRRVSLASFAAAVSSVAVVACSSPSAEIISSSCSGPFALDGDAIYANCRGRVARLDLDGDERWTTPEIVHRFGGPIVVSPDFPDEVFLVSDDVIATAAKADGATRVIVTKPTATAVVSMAIATPYLYWIELPLSDPVPPSLSSLRRVPVSGGTVETIDEVPGLMGPVVVDAETVYWAQATQIRRLDRDTDQITTFATFEIPGVGVTTMIADRPFLYTTNKDDQIVRIAKATGEVQVLAGGLELAYLALGHDYVFSGTFRVTLTTGLIEQFLPDELAGPVATDDTYIYWTSAPAWHLEGFLSRRPMEGPPSARAPADRPHPPLVGVGP